MNHPLTDCWMAQKNVSSWFNESIFGLMRNAACYFQDLCYHLAPFKALGALSRWMSIKQWSLTDFCLKVRTCTCSFSPGTSWPTSRDLRWGWFELRRKVFASDLLRWLRWSRRSNFCSKSPTWPSLEKRKKWSKTFFATFPFHPFS